MNFPEISYLEDILPAIHDTDVISVNWKPEGYCEVTYRLQERGLFDHPVHGPMRRECRGLLFGEDGEILSRGFHKFFNINEIGETMMENLDFSEPHHLETKLDGSMLRPFILDGELRFGSKRGITDLANQAWRETVGFSIHDGELEWMKEMCLRGITPIFEYTSPNNRIVVSYEEPKIVLLACRENISGRYLAPEEYKDYPGAKVMTDKTVIAPDIFLSSTRGLTDFEGYVVVWPDGNRVKVKSNWYVKLHKVRESINEDRHIFWLAINGKLDDIYPLLNDSDRAELDGKADKHLRMYRDMKWRVEQVASGAVSFAYRVDGDRKRVSLEYVSRLRPWYAKFAFAAVSGRDVEAMFQTEIEKRLGSRAKFEDLTVEYGYNPYDTKEERNDHGTKADQQQGR